MKTFDAAINLLLAQMKAHAPTHSILPHHHMTLLKEAH